MAVIIEDDHALEGTEEVSVHLNATDEDVKLLYKYSTITVLDNDGTKELLINIHVSVIHHCIQKT